MNIQLPTAKSIFLEAIEKSPAERAAFLDQACAGDLQLMAQVQKLVRSHEALGTFHEAAAVNVTPPPLEAFDQPPAEGAGVTIGLFKLLEQIGEGGMGLVYMAEQQRPMRRLVALKIIKPGMDSRQVIARFEAERQALALMDHANIAKVLDAGTTEAGRPYFVMELVKGIPITKYCDQLRLTLRQRLELFIPVCQAIQHAHQKGIIHRDIKPTNVLVALYDGAPVPKVIDFGVAKATEQKLTEKTMVTGFGQLIGTLDYMSPEQAQFNQLDIDTRSDVYSLGVLLYELLTGTTPFEQSRRDTVALDETLRIIREEEPPKPSTRLSTAAMLPTIAANRNLEPAQLRREVTGDLDLIVMKALEKDRNRRYETANGLALDLQRYLDDEAVMARPPSASYRLRKFVRRHRAAVVASAAVLLALFLGIVGTTIGLVRAQQAHEAESKRADGEREAKRVAEKRLEQVQAGYEILTSVFRELDPQAEHKEAKPLRAILGSRLEYASQRLEGEVIGDPLLVARLQTNLGISLLGLGYPDLAAELYSKTCETYRAHFGLDSDESLEARSFLARAYREADKEYLSIPLEEETLRIRRAAPGTPIEKLIYTMKSLARDYQSVGQLELALPLFEEALRLAQSNLGDDDRATLGVMSSLASAYQSAGQLAKGLSLSERTYELAKAKHGLADGDVMAYANVLANAYMRAKKHDLSVPLFEDVLERRKAKLGHDHPDTLDAMSNYGLALLEAGKIDRALGLFDETLTLRRKRLPADDSRIPISMNNLALAYQWAGKDADAVPLFEEALASYRTHGSANYASTLTLLKNLAQSYNKTGNSQRAVELLEEAVAGLEKLQFRHPYADRIVSSLVSLYDNVLKRHELAEPWRRKWLEVVKERSGPLSLEYAQELALLGFNLVQQGKFAEAEAMLRQALAIREEKQPDEWATFSTRSTLGGALLGLKKYGEAERLLIAGYEGMEQREAEIPQNSKVRLVQALDRLVKLYEALGNPAEVARWRAERDAQQSKLNQNKP